MRSYFIALVLVLSCSSSVVSAQDRSMSTSAGQGSADSGGHAQRHGAIGLNLEQRFDFEIECILEGGEADCVYVGPVFQYVCQCVPLHE